MKLVGNIFFKVLFWIADKTRFRKQQEGSSYKAPLRFTYKSKAGRVSDITLYGWVAEEEYIAGSPDPLGRLVPYRKDRIIRFLDLSYRQMPGYRAPPGSPLDPKRLP